MIRFLIALLLVLTVAVCILPAQKPLVAGRPISQFLEELTDASKETRELAERDLRALGTNALPWMLAYCTRSGPAFRVLGPTASPAIPRLMQLVGDRNFCSEGANALIFIGPEGIQSLTGALTNKNPEIRACVLEAMDSSARQEPLPLRFERALPAIVECAKDSNPRVVRAAMNALGSMTTNGQLKVQAYVRCLGSEDPGIRESAAAILQFSGSHSNLAIPALLQALRDTNAHVRERAGISLQAIAPAEAAKVGVSIRQYE